MNMIYFIFSNFIHSSLTGTYRLQFISRHPWLPVFNRWVKQICHYCGTVIPYPLLPVLPTSVALSAQSFTTHLRPCLSPHPRQHSPAAEHQEAPSPFRLASPETRRVVVCLNGPSGSSLLRASPLPRFHRAPFLLPRCPRRVPGGRRGGSWTSCSNARPLRTAAPSYSRRRPQIQLPFVILG